MPLKLSVIVFFYNHGHSLAKTLRSIILNTFISLEVLIIVIAADDQESSLVIHSLETEPLPGVKVIRKNIWSIIQAYHAGITQAQGQYLLAIWGDSLLPREYSETLLKELENNPTYRFVYTDYILYKENTFKKIMLPEYSLIDMLKENGLIIPTAMSRTSQLQEIVKEIHSIEISSQIIWAYLSSKESHSSKKIPGINIHLNNDTFYKLQATDKLQSIDILKLPAKLRTTNLEKSLL